MADVLIGAALGCCIAALALYARGDWRSAGVCIAVSTLLFVLASVVHDTGGRRRRP